MLHITVCDNGTGYPEEFLNSIRSDTYTEQKDGHIGIRNSITRLRFLYNGKASCSFYNDGGAVAEFFLPLSSE